ncbi:porin B precursor [Aquitalea magnusonii]|uniref:Porin B n=1 Tax=Aquitalea magnusonii TaxID=332411 RepID=A0A3G9GNY0_9NEIS|nr:carbohydrate porin [Aquitalea magnusonii]BBF86716.1 porin B precursor [Aquitalea magnusonii]
MTTATALLMQERQPSPWPTPAILLSLLACAGLPALSHAAPAESWDGYVLGMENTDNGVLGDMHGLRSTLAQHGFTFNSAWLSQLARNIEGGFNSDRHSAYIDQFWFMFTQDLSAATGIPDAKIEGNIVNRNHDNNLTAMRLQDNRVTGGDLAQESWGGQSITRLGWLTFSRSFLDQRLQWRLGLMNKVQDFDQSIPCDFQLLNLCGGKAAAARTWYNWNSHYWGSTFQYKITPEWTVKTGLLEQNPEAPSRSHAWSVSTQGSKGVLFPLELEWKTNSVNGLPGIYNLGWLYTNARQNALFQGHATQPEQYRHTGYWYAGLNQQLTRHHGDKQRGLSFSWSLGLGDKRSNPIPLITSASLRYRGLLDSRPQDMMGIGTAWMHYSSNYQRQQQYLNTQSGISDYADAAYAPIPGYAMNSEFFYRAQLRPWLQLQPGIQYWRKPAGLKETPDAWVVTLKTVVIF